MNIQRELRDEEREFLVYCQTSKALLFSQDGFKLKSGRVTPRFFNAGQLLRTASWIQQVSQMYVAGLLGNFSKDGVKIDVDFLYGPAYKWIPLAVSVGQNYFLKTGHDIWISTHRKETKDHGEWGKGLLMWVKGKRGIMIDDVITAGTAFRQSIADVVSDGGHISWVQVLLDRKEVIGGAMIHTPRWERQSALQEIEKTYQISVHAILDYWLVKKAIEEGIIGDLHIWDMMDRYQETYGV